MKHFTGLRAIFFDYGGTLDSSGRAWKEHFWPIYQRHGVEVDYDMFVQAFYRSDDSLVKEGRPDLTLSRIVHEQVRRVLEHIAINNAGLAEKIAGDFYRSSMDSINAAMPVLRLLHETFRLGIISNNYGNLEAICRETGLASVMDVMVDSRVIGAEKPDRTIFLSALDALDLRPEQAMMVGDSFPRDIEGALSLGMKAAWLVPEGKKEAAPGKRLSPDMQVITGLHEIPALVGLEAE
jgi:putative hydrolase of the HAD superfamily